MAHCDFENASMRNDDSDRLFRCLWPLELQVTGHVCADCSSSMGYLFFWSCKSSSYVLKTSGICNLKVLSPILSDFYFALMIGIFEEQMFLILMK